MADGGDDVEKNEAEEEEETEEEGGPLEVAILPLQRCMRILPRDQDIGGFFIAVFRKVAPFKAILKTKEWHKARILHKLSDKRPSWQMGRKVCWHLFLSRTIPPL